MWENRFQCTDFLDKEVSEDKVTSICNMIPHIPEPPTGMGFSRVIWFLLSKSNPKHRKLAEYLVENYHMGFQKNDYRNPDNLPVHFGQLLQAPYLLHGTLLRMSERYPDHSQFTYNSVIIEEVNKIDTYAKMSVYDMKQYVNLGVHAGAILTQIVNLGLNCCFIGTLKGRFMNFPKLITNEQEREFTDMMINTFPNLLDNSSQFLNAPTKSKSLVGIHSSDTLCPGMSIAFGYGTKHDDPTELISDDKYVWPAVKDRKKYPNLYK